MAAAVAAAALYARRGLAFASPNLFFLTPTWTGPHHFYDYYYYYFNQTIRNKGVPRIGPRMYRNVLLVPYCFGWYSSPWTEV